MVAGHRASGIGRLATPTRGGAYKPLIKGVLAGEVVGRPILDVAGLWQARCGPCATWAVWVWCPYAISAVDTAL